MKTRLVVLLAAAGCWLSSATVAWAGMGQVTLSDVPRVLTLSNLAKFRLDAISFFLLVILGSTWIIQQIWNSLSRDVPKLPRLSYLRALSLVALWGLLFVLVLAMISGARELMTPGAWEKKGFAYQLVRDPPAAEKPATSVTEAKPASSLKAEAPQ
jgi:hypothetical protein